MVRCKKLKIVEQELLQYFIEDNAGKNFGDEYRYGGIIIYTQINQKTTGERLINVSIMLPWVTFYQQFNNKEITNNIGFYNWLEHIFIPSAKEELISKYKNA